MLFVLGSVVYSVRLRHYPLVLVFPAKEKVFRLWPSLQQRTFLLQVLKYSSAYVIGRQLSQPNLRHGFPKATLKTPHICALESSSHSLSSKQQQWLFQSAVFGFITIMNNLFHVGLQEVLKTRNDPPGTVSRCIFCCKDTDSFVPAAGADGALLWSVNISLGVLGEQLSWGRNLTHCWQSTHSSGEDRNCANARLLLYKSIQRIILGTTGLNININANSG